MTQSKYQGMVTLVLNQEVRRNKKGRKIGHALKFKTVL